MLQVTALTRCYERYSIALESLIIHVHETFELGHLLQTACAEDIDDARYVIVLSVRLCRICARHMLIHCSKPVPRECDPEEYAWTPKLRRHRRPAQVVALVGPAKARRHHVTFQTPTERTDAMQSH